MPDETQITHFEDRPPKWLESVLDSTSVPEEFQMQLHKAGVAACLIDRMRQARANDAFVPMPFGRYVEELAALLDLDLTPLRETLRIEGFSEVTDRVLPLWAKLARQLDFAVREARSLLRMSVAESQGLDARVMLVAWKDGPPQIDACEQALSTVERGYSVEARARLHAALASVEREYADGD